MKTNAEKHIWKINSFLLLVGVLILSIHNRSLTRQVELLEAERNTYSVKESKSYIVERISNQMEEIAYQQKEISDQQREEAVHQMGIAEQMRVRAEEGENLAKQEQHKAQQYALLLEDARNVAEGERAKAVKQQKLAEAARNEADTLSRISLARSLASSSLIQYQSGNYDISSLLACEAWNLMKKYKGDVFHPILYDALSKNSKSSLTRKIHKGGVVCMAPVDHASETFFSISKYGEISRWNRNGNRLEQQHLLTDSIYSFRDFYCDASQQLYVLDFYGNLVFVKENRPVSTMALPESRGWQRICPFNEQTYLLVSAQHIYFFDPEHKQIRNSIALPQFISAIGHQEDKWLVFGKKRRLLGNQTRWYTSTEKMYS